MKHKTSKYIAAAIIVTGLFFIYLIPHCFLKKEYPYASEYQRLFNNAISKALIENITLDANNDMIGTVTFVTDQNNDYKLEEEKNIGPMRKHITSGHNIKHPDGAIILINMDSSEYRFFINNKTLSVNGSSIDDVKKSIDMKTK